MSGGILIDLSPTIFAVLVAIGMAAAGLLLGVTSGGIVTRLGRFLSRKSEVR